MDSSLALKYKKISTRVMITMIIMYIVMTGIGWTTVTLYAQPIIEEWGILRSSFMLTVTLMSLGNTFMTIFFFGPINAKLGNKKQMLFPGILIVISFIFFTFAQNLAMLYIGGILFGVGISSLCYSMALTVFQTWGGQNLATKMGFIQTLGSVSGIVCTTVFGYIINSIGWRPSWGLTLIIHAVALAVMLVLYKGDPKDVGLKEYVDELSKQQTTAAGEDGAEAVVMEEDGLSRKEMLRTPNYFMLIIGFCMLGLIVYGVLGNLVLFASDFGFTEISGTMLSVALITSAVFFTPGGRIADKLGSRWMVIICMICSIISMVILSRPAISLPVLVVAALLAGVAYDACLYVAGISCREAFGAKEYNKKVGLVAGFDSLGVSFGPTVLTLFFDFGGGYAMGLYIYIVMAVICMILIALGTRRAKVPGSAKA